MTQTIAYGEYHIANLPIVHGFIVVIDNDTGTVIKSYEGLATGEDGSQKAIGFLPSDKIQAYSRNGLPNVYSSEYPLQELYTGSSSDLSKLLAIGDNTVTAINNADIGYPILELVPTDKTTGVSNSNLVISTILKAMSLPDPGPTSGTTPGSRYNAVE